MGAAGATKKAVKTSAEVKKDLYKKVCDNARNLLKQKTGQNLPDTAELDDIMLPLAEWKFKDEYTFAFEKDPLMYKNKNLPDALQGTITPVAQLCSITEGSNIDGFIDTVLLSKVDLPAWMAGNAKGALKTLAAKLTSQETFLQCRFDAYQQSFDGQKEDEDSWRVKSVIVYMKGSLLEDDISADITIVYFLAIYYKTLSPTQTVRNKIRDAAFRMAQTYTSWSGTIDDVSVLDKALASYSEKKFNDRFRFQYLTTTPPDYDRNASSPLITRSSHLFYFPDLRKDDLKETIRVFLFQGLNIPDKYPNIKEKTLGDIVDHFNQVLNDPKSGAWVDTFINQSYSPKDPTLNPVQMNVVVAHFYDHKAADNQIPVSNTYIFCLCLLWEVVSPEKILTQDIFRMMVNQLSRHLNRGESKNSDMIELKSILHEYAKDEFRRRFGFDWNGDSSRPTDLISGGKVRGFEALAAFPTYPVDTNEITQWIDIDLFTRTSNKFPPYARAKIYDDLKDDVIYRTKHFPDNSMWYSHSQDRTYESVDTGGGKTGGGKPIDGGSKPSTVTPASGQSIKVSTTYVYGLGNMAEKGVYKQMPFVFVLMVARSTIEESW